MKTWSLTAKLVATGTSFLLLALVSIGLTLWVTWKLEGGAAAVNEAGRLRMQTYRTAMIRALGADAAEVEQQARVFDRSLALLAAGDPSRPLFVPWSEASHERFEAVQARWRELRPLLAEPASATAIRSRADEFAGLVNAMVSAVEEDIARWTAVLNLFQLTMMALAIGSAVAMMYAGYLLVLNPVARLQRGVAALQQGDLSARVEVDRQDEFGALSAAFNDMAGALQSLYGSLEDKVREKTERLELKRRRLAELYEVSAFLSRATTLDALAEGFARHVRRIASADAAAVRWCEEGRLRYHMLAAEGLPEQITRGEACLASAACHCGQAPGGTHTRVIPILPQAGQSPPQCAQAGFDTLVSVPVSLHDRVVGEVDLFFRGPAALQEGDRELLDALASHLASAMESLRAQALEREAAVAEERGLLARELHDSIAQALAFMKIEVKLLRQAVSREDALAVQRIIGELDQGIRECHADVRELLVHFRTRATEGDINASLRTTVQKFEHQTGLPVALEIGGQGLPVPPDVQVQVLHVIQEALSNVRKHAQASRVTVRAASGPPWRFEVEDDGLGFDPAAARGHSHVGLRIMHERAARIGARVRVEAAPGRGTRVTLTLAAPGALPAREEQLEVA